jgi:hypothetical protein
VVKKILTFLSVCQQSTLTSWKTIKMEISNAPDIQKLERAKAEQPTMSIAYVPSGNHNRRHSGGITVSGSYLGELGQLPAVSPFVAYSI